MSPDGEKIISSDEALEIRKIPSHVVIGGGYIGVEFATLFSTLGSKVTIVEILESILPGLEGEWSGISEGSWRGMASRFNPIVGCRDPAAGRRIEDVGERRRESRRFGQRRFFRPWEGLLIWISIFRRQGWRFLLRHSSQQTPGDDFQSCLCDRGCNRRVAPGSRRLGRRNHRG